MTSTSVLLALNGSIILLAGLVGGLFFARAIARASGEVAWRVVHSGGCSAGAMLLALAVPVQWVTLADALVLALVWSFLIAIWNTRGIPGAGSLMNRVVNILYGAGTALSLAGGVLLVAGLLRTH